MDHVVVSKKSPDTPILLSRSLIVLHFIFRSVTHFKLIFVKREKSVSNFIWMSNYSSTILEETNFALLYSLCSFVKSQWTILMWVYFWTLSSVSSVYLPIPLPIPQCFDWYAFWNANVMSGVPAALLGYKVEF